MDTIEQSGALHIPGFEMIEKIGQGGMAVVWKARQISLDRIVAIKVLSAQYKHDAADVQRFQSEAQQAAKLKHAGIVQVYDTGVVNGVYYIVMEYVAGYTVGDWVRRKGALSEKEALQVCEHVAKALEYAWQKAGIIHCDVKPDNVILDADGSVKVADLGLSRTIKAMSATEADGEIMGTPAYISPEQATGVPDLDCRADIYSLGAMLYHLVTGKLLFEGRPDALVMELQVSDTVPNALDVNPKVSRHLCTLIERMLAKNRDSRYRDWTAVRADMVRINKGLPLIRPAPHGGSTMRPPSRPKSTVMPQQVPVQAQKSVLPIPVPVLIAVAVAVLVGIIVLVLSQSNRQARVVDRPMPLRADLPPVHTTAVYQTGTPAQTNPAPGTGISRPPTVQEEAAEARKKQAAIEQAHEEAKRGKQALEEARRTQSLRTENKMSNLLERLTLELTAGGVEPTLKMVNQAYEDPELEPKRDVIGTVKGLLESAATIDQRIIDSLKAEIGREVSVQLTNGVKKLTIVSVKDGKVSGQQVVRTGGSLITVPLTFEARDLSQREKIVRMGSEESKPDVALIKGLMAWNAKAYPQARKFFAFTHPLLADRLVACVAAAERIEEEKRVAAAQAVEKPGDEPDAVKTNAVAIKPPALSGKLAAIEGNADAIRSYLLDRNPDMLTRECIFKTDKAGKVFRVEIWSENVSDIGALAAFRDLKELVCGARGRVCKLSDLSAVRGLPLESLYVEFAGVRDLSCLKGMTLKRIAIRHCPLADLSPLKDMTSLQELQLKGTEVKDLSPIKGMKLKRLELCSTRVADIRLLSGMPLESLEISDTMVKDISVIKDMPLRSLNLAKSRVFNFAPLSGLALTSLNVTGTQFRELSRLKAMPLKSLYMGDISVTDLSPLRGHQLGELFLVGIQARDYSVFKDMPIRVLNLSGSRAEDLVFVKDMPLERLDISDTKIADLSPLKGKPLTHLQINGTQVNDLRPLEGLALKYLNCRNVAVSNFDPLKNMPLTSIDMDEPNSAAKKILRSLPKLEYVNGQSYER
jgi:serine/threonine-protein kinase